MGTEYIVKLSGKERYLLNPSAIGASAGPKTFTLLAKEARKFTKPQAYVEAGKLQRQGFHTVVLPAPDKE